MNTAIHSSGADPGIFKEIVAEVEPLDSIDVVHIGRMCGERIGAGVKNGSLTAAQLLRSRRHFRPWIRWDLVKRYHVAGAAAATAATGRKQDQRSKPQ